MQECLEEGYYDEGDEENDEVDFGESEYQIANRQSVLTKARNK